MPIAPLCQCQAHLPTSASDPDPLSIDLSLTTLFCLQVEAQFVVADHSLPQLPPILACSRSSRHVVKNLVLKPSSRRMSILQKLDLPALTNLSLY